MATQTQQLFPKSSYEKKLEKINKQIEENANKRTVNSQNSDNLEGEWNEIRKEANRVACIKRDLREQLKKITLEQKAVLKKLEKNEKEFIKTVRNDNNLTRKEIQLQTQKTKMVYMNKCRNKVKKDESDKKIEHNQLVKKSTVESSRKFLDAITNTLPEDIVSYIATFIPTTVRIQLLESRFDFTKLTKHISQIDNNKQISFDYFKIRFLEKLCNCPEYLNSLSNLQRKRHMNSSTQVGFINPYYSPDWHTNFRNKRDIQMLFQYAILKFKSLNPEHAFKVMKTMSILIDPTKNYRYNANYRQKVGNYSL